MLKAITVGKFQMLHWWYIYHSGRCKEGTPELPGAVNMAPTPHLPPHDKFKTLLVETVLKVKLKEVHARLHAGECTSLFT